MVFSYWKDWKIKNFTKIIAILFKPFSGSFSLQSHFKVKTYTGLGSTGLPGLPGYNGWNPLANDKKNCGRKNVSLDLQKYQKNCPVGTLNANRKQCANLVNMPDWHIWIKCSEIKWRKNFWLQYHLDMSSQDCLWDYVECQVNKFCSMN